MGGLGSGRWGWHQKKRTVEDSRRLTLGTITRSRVLTPGQTGTITWSRGDQVVATIGYEIVAAAGGGLAIRLGYTWTPGYPPDAGPKTVTLDVRLVLGAVPRGGSRWWGVCPLAVNGVSCGRRVGTLYLAPGSPYFGCRRCHRLTYTSCQKHDNRVSRLARDPEALFKLVERPGTLPVPQLGLILGALTLLQRRLDRDQERFEKRCGRTDR